MSDLPKDSRDVFAELPQTWEMTRVESIANLVMGQSPPSETYNEEGIGLPFLQGKAEFGPIYPTPVKWCSRPLKVAPEGAILVSVRAPVGDVNIAPSQICIGRGLGAVVVEKADRDFTLDLWCSCAHWLSE